MLDIFSVVADSDRDDFLPSVFGSPAFLLVENCCFNIAEKTLEGYSGGFWDFVKNSDGHGYLRPNYEGVARLSTEWESLPVSSDAAGLVITIMASNMLIWHYHHKGAPAHVIQKLRDNYDYLMSCFGDHPEHSAIWRFLD